MGGLFGIQEIPSPIVILSGKVQEQVSDKFPIYLSTFTRKHAGEGTNLVGTQNETETYWATRSPVADNNDAWFHQTSVDAEVVLAVGTFDHTDYRLHPVMLRGGRSLGARSSVRVHCRA